MLEKFKQNFCGIVIIFCIAMLAAFYLRSRESVSGDGDGAARVASGIESAKEANQRAEADRSTAESGIDQAEETAGNIEKSISRSETATEQLDASVERCQQLLDTIRSRGEGKTD